MYLLSYSILYCKSDLSTCISFFNTFTLNSPSSLVSCLAMKLTSLLTTSQFTILISRASILALNYGCISISLPDKIWIAWISFKFSLSILSNYSKSTSSNLLTLFFACLAGSNSGNVSLRRFVNYIMFSLNAAFVLFSSKAPWVNCL